MKKLLLVMVCVVMITYTSSGQDSAAVTLSSKVQTALKEDMEYISENMLTANPLSQKIWEFFLSNVTFAVLDGDSIYFMEVVDSVYSGTNPVIGFAYYFEEQVDWVQKQMTRRGEGGAYVQNSRNRKGDYDVIFLNFAIEPMQAPVLRAVTLFHEAVHFWIQNNVAIPVFPHRARALHETTAYILSWEFGLSLMHPGVDSLFTELLIELDRENMPAGYYGARIPGITPECLADEIEDASAGVFTAGYILSIATLYVGTEEKNTPRWYREKYKKLKKGGLI